MLVYAILVPLLGGLAGGFAMDGINTRRRLNALRRNCFLTNERGHRVRYDNAAPDLQAMAER